MLRLLRIAVLISVIVGVLMPIDSQAASKVAPKLSADAVAMLLATVIVLRAECNFSAYPDVRIADLVRSSGYRYEDFATGAKYAPLVKAKIDGAGTFIQSMGLKEACKGMVEAVSMFWPQLVSRQTQPATQAGSTTKLSNDDTAMMLASFVMLGKQCSYPFNPNSDLQGYVQSFGQNITDYMPDGSQSELMESKLAILAVRLRKGDKASACRTLETSSRQKWPGLFQE